MKKPLFLLSLLCFVTLGLLGQQVVTTTLNENDNCYSEPLKYANGSITVCVTYSEEDDQPALSLTLENTDESTSFLVFGHAWSKKELRKARIVNKTSNNKNTETSKFDGISFDQEIAPSEDFKFPDIEATSDEEFVCQLPFYIAKKKKGFLGMCKKTVLYEKQIVELHITIDPKYDEEYIELQKEVDAICQEYQSKVDNNKFCSSPNHSPSLKSQTKKYVEKRDKLKKSINRKRTENGWAEDSKPFRKYQELLTKLDSIDPETIHYDCRNHGHSCNYCKLSLEEIYRKLENYYKSIYSGTKTKSDVWEDVTKLYNCYSKSSKNPDRKKESSVIKDGIQKYYNLIKNM